MKRQILVFLLLVWFPLCILFAQETSIPDANFEQALVDLGIDSDGEVNGVVLTEDISTVTNLNVVDKGIADLTGIEDFESLEALNCSNNQLTALNNRQNITLLDLNCSSNQIESLDLSNNSALKKLNCQDNLLTNLSLINTTNNEAFNPELEALDVSSNQIQSIDISKNEMLLSVRCSNNQLTTLEVDSNTKLEELFCSNNQLDALEVTANLFLRNLLCASNQIKELNLVENDSIILLDVSSNQLKNLDVRNNRLITNLTCSDNQLKELNLSMNDSLKVLGCSNNQLKLLEVDNNTKLESLITAFNQLADLRVYVNQYLKSIDVSFNLISEIDISENDSITSLNCAANQLRSLKINNGNNEELKTLNAINNPNLYCIEVDAISEIGDGWFKDNSAAYRETCEPVTFVPDDKFELALIDLGYDVGPLDDLVKTSSIDTITVLDIVSTGIARLTGIQDFVALDSLKCADNILKNLDVTSLVNLKYLDCSSNDLTDLTLRNDPLVELDFLNATTNPNLTCIQVDDVAAAEAEPNWSIDVTTFYSLDCNTNKTRVPDPNFEQALIDFGYDSGSVDGYVVTDSIHKIETLNVSNRNIFDLTGIEAFVALDSLNCSENQLSSLSITTNRSLKNLSCFSNNLTELDITRNDSLIKLNCGNNNLTLLDVQGKLDLVELVCDNNNLTQLNVSNLPSLEAVDCSSNDITTTGGGVAGLNIANTSLKQLLCAKNEFVAIDIEPVSGTLEELDCADNNISILDISTASGLKKLNCSLNFLKDIDFSANMILEALSCDSNQITDLIYNTTAPYAFFTSLSCDDNVLKRIDGTQFEVLTMLSCASNELTDLEIISNAQLDTLNFSGNRIVDINLTENRELKFLDCSNNPLDDLILTNNVNLEQLYCGNAQLTTLDLEQNNALKILSCPDNEIETIGLTNTTNIETLDLSANRFLAINDLDKLIHLKNFNAASNQLEEIRLGIENNLLADINVSSNTLVRLNIQNGNNDNLLRFNAVNNPDLSCIQIDNENNVGKDWQKDDSASYSSNCRYDDTFVPDDGFEEALAIYDDIPNDNYVPAANIRLLTSLDISKHGISDLTGIEDFVALQSLNCSYNALENLLDLRSNTNLTALICTNNQIDSLFVSDNYIIQTLDISSNQFSDFDTTVFSDLEKFGADDNQFTNLNLSANNKLTEISCSANQLVTLSVDNGNNSSLLVFNAQNNPDLICIEIDDINTIGASWQKDAAATYSENCYYNQTFIPDDGFEQALINLGIDSGPLDDYVSTAVISSITNLNIRGNDVSDLTGLEDFTSLVSFNCQNNLLTSIDIRSNIALERLLCSGNQLTRIDRTDISSNTVLTYIDVSDNLLTSIDISANPALLELNCSSNQLTSIDVVQNPNIKTLLCASNQLVTANINNGFNITLENLDLTDNPNLTCVLVDDIAAANANSNWFKDEAAAYKRICDDDDKDGVPDVEDLCPNTPFGSVVDLFGCTFFALPVTNFTILTTSENCRSSNNGKVYIEALEIFNYKATIIGDEVNAEYDFTNDVEIRNLRAGAYNLCITINEEPDYIRCFEIVITEPEALSVEVSVNSSQTKASLAMSGGAPYIIDFNGLIFSTQDPFTVLELRKGINSIKVNTDKECQGTFEKTIFTSDEVLFYPNPLQDHLNVLIGNKDAEEVDITIYSFLGQVVTSKRHTISNGSIRVDTSSLESGVYMISVGSESFQSTFKIVKK